MPGTVLYELDGHVATITYNRPDALNAVNGELRRDLNDAFSRFRDEEDAWVAIVTGAGRAFCAGADLRDGAGSTGEFAGHVLGEADDELLRERLGDLQAGDRRRERLLPGLRADARDVVRLRRSPASGPSSASPRSPSACRRSSGPSACRGSIGWQPAMELLLTGERIDADRAKEIGLAGWVVPHDELLPEARRLADRLVRAAPLAARATKEVAVRSQHLSTVEAIRFGETMRKVAGATEDAAEGMRAAAERRPPVWKGR